MSMYQRARITLVVPTRSRELRVMPRGLMATDSCSNPSSPDRGGVSIEEIPLVFHDRVAGKSKMSIKIMAGNLLLITWWELPSAEKA
jgi:hypothetical protein